MHSYQSQSPNSLARVFVNSISEENQNKNLVQTPTPIDIGDSLDLIQFKCYQDILKSKSDHRAKNVPLSYSKSIQYLGQETNMFLKMNEGNRQQQEDKNTNTKQLETVKKSLLYVQNVNICRSNDGTMPILKKNDYYSPVNERVQRLIQRSVQKQRGQQEQQISEHLMNNQGFKIHKSESEYFNRKDDVNRNQSGLREKGEFQSNANSESTNRNDRYSTVTQSQATNTQQLIQSYISKHTQFMSPQIQKRESVLIQEKFPLKSIDKIKLQNTQIPKQKQFTPLKIHPPFVKRAYAEKSKTYTMGFLKNNINDFCQSNNVIHSNNNIRQLWQNRIGNSQSRQSLMNWEMQETNGWTQQNKGGNYTPRQNQFSQYQDNDNINEQDNQYYPQTTDQVLNQHEFHQTNFDQLMQYANYKNINNHFNQGTQEIEYQNIQNEDKVEESQGRSTFNKMNRYQSSKSQTPSIKINTINQVNQLKTDGFNHFYKSNLLKNDLEFINQQKIKAQLSQQQGFKQQAQISDAEMIIQNQMPGSKIILKRVHQRNLTQKNEPEINHKVYYTIPNRQNFFKSKNFGVFSIDQNQNNMNENPFIK